MATAKRTATRRASKSVRSLSAAHKKAVAAMRKRHVAARRRQTLLQRKARARLKQIQAQERQSLTRTQKLELRAQKQADRQAALKRRQAERLKAKAAAAKKKARKKAPKKRAKRKTKAKPTKPKAKAKAKTKARFSAARVRQAYGELVARYKSPHVVILELAETARVPVPTLKSWLLSEAKAGRASFALGEPTLASKEQLAAAMPIEGRPYLYVELIGFESVPASKPTTARVRPGSPHHAPAPRSRFADDFREAFDLARASLGGRNLVPLSRLRSDLWSRSGGYSRAAFDSGLNALRRAGMYSLSPHEGRAGTLSAADARAGIREGGRLLVYAAERKES